MQDRDATNRLHTWWLRFSLRPLFLLLISVAILFSCITWLVHGRDTKVAIRFQHDTGLPFPTSAKVISDEGDYGGFTGDGTHVLILDCDPEELQDWLTHMPPWGARAWKHAPVPLEVPAPESFKPDCYSGAGSVWYTVRERKCGQIRWHNGELLMFDPDRGRVWFFSWDF